MTNHPTRHDIPCNRPANDASRRAPPTWTSLDDPAILQACMPGCESPESTGDNESAVVTQAAIGPFKGKFKGKLSLPDIQAPNSDTRRINGTGGVVGFGRGTARVALEPHDEGTLLRYRSTVRLGRKLAQIGSRPVVSATKKNADDVFEKCRIELASRSLDGASPQDSSPHTNERSVDRIVRWPAARRY